MVSSQLLVLAGLLVMLVMGCLLLKELGLRDELTWSEPGKEWLEEEILMITARWTIYCEASALFTFDVIHFVQCQALQARDEKGMIV